MKPNNTTLHINPPASHSGVGQAPSPVPFGASPNAPSDSSPSYASHPSPHSISTPVAPPKPPVIPPIPLNLIKKSSRSDDRIANLPPEDQAKIIHWFCLGLTYTKIIELAAQPRPDGSQNLETALEILAQTHAVHTMATPALDHAGFRQLSRYLLRQQEYRLRQRSLDLREKRIAFDMQHKHYDIFKRTVEKLTEINEIVRNKSLTPEQKIREHWIKTFGIETAEMIERANKKWAETHPEDNHTTPDYSDDIVPQLTPEEKQAAVTRALHDMLGIDAGADTPKNSAHLFTQPDTTDQTSPMTPKPLPT